MFKKLIEYLYWKTHKPDWDSAYFPKERTAKLFAELKKVDGFTDFLKVLLKADRIRHFSVSEKDSESRGIIKGEYTRTMYLLKSTRSDEESQLINQKVGGRYGS